MKKAILAASIAASFFTATFASAATPASDNARIVSSYSSWAEAAPTRRPS